MRLSLRVELLPGESLPSFLSRMADANGVSPNAFCAHLTINALDFINGDSAEIEKMSDLSGVASSRLMRNAIISVDDGFELAGERLRRSSLHRDRLRVCPCCLQEDLNSGQSLYARTFWHVAHLRSCLLHGFELIELDRPTTPSIVHDVVARLKPVQDGLDQLRASAKAVPSSAFESYVHGRLRGTHQDSAFLDSLELHAAARLCEMVGTTALHGIWRSLQDVDAKGWREAADAGFAIASDGISGIRAFLSRVQSKRLNGATGHDGPQAVFGALHDWLARGVSHPAYDPIRDVVRQHIIETMPVKVDEVILGQRVDQQVVHSVRTVHLQSGLHPKRLTKILQAENIISDRATSDGLKRFAADRGETLLKRLAGALSLKEVGAYLGSDRLHTRVLHEAGHIRSITATGGKMAFTTDDLDRFLSDLTADADTLPSDDANAVSIPIAAKRSNCSSTEIVQLVLDRKLTRRGLRNGQRRYDCLLVDFEEVRDHVRGEELDGLPRRWIIKELKTNYLVVDALIKHGVLETRQEINPKNRCPIEIVPREAFDRFRATFATLFELSAQLGCHPRTLKATLEAKGIRPEFSKEEFHASFYRRADISI